MAIKHQNVNIKSRMAQMDKCRTQKYMKTIFTSKIEWVFIDYFVFCNIEIIQVTKYLIAYIKNSYYISGLSVMNCTLSSTINYQVHGTKSVQNWAKCCEMTLMSVGNLWDSVYNCTRIQG